MSFLHDTTHFGSHLVVYLCSFADTANIFFHLETPINQSKFIELVLKKRKIIACEIQSESAIKCEKMHCFALN